MGKDAIPYVSFKKPGKTDDKVTPGKAQQNDEECYEDDQTSKIQQLGICYAGFQAVNSLFDNTRDCQLQKIN